MSPTARFVALLCFSLIAGAFAGIPAHAQEPSTSPSQDLRAWAKTSPVPGSRLHETAVTARIRANDELHPFDREPVVGLGITGRVQLTSARGLVRLIAVDEQGREYLVYETYSLIAPSRAFQIRDGCRETCVIPPTVFSSLKAEIVDASFQIHTIVTNQWTPRAAARAESAARARQHARKVKAAQETALIGLLNRQIKRKGLKWTAGPTSISQLSYAEKKRLFPRTFGDRSTPPNLQGAEYYKAGILEVTPEAAVSSAASGSSALIDSFDWRSRHGANRPGSPYYDGDPDGGGWMTSIKSQRCADCWAHSAAGATEAQVNLYFNQHVDVDLSEQELVSCSGAGGCYGGSPGGALSYIQRVGVVEEGCFPESGMDEQCRICPAPRERILLTGFSYIDPYDGEDNIKRKLIASGPLPFGIPSWWHALVLVGYQREPGTGDTVWILKNSWGPGWGEHGYGYVKVPLTDMYFVYELDEPISLLAPYSIACRDADRDGYYNWGISPAGALACRNAPSIEDCDDSDPTVALMTDDGRCVTADTTPPAITIGATPSVLWPPDGKTTVVRIAGTITDDGSGVNASTARYAIGDEYGRVRSSGSLALGGDGTYTFTVALEASRYGGDKDGRQYTITVLADDRAGNRGSSGHIVSVPHDMR